MDNTHEIVELYIKITSGIASGEDVQRAEFLRQSDPQALRKWKECEQQFEAPAVKAHFELSDTRSSYRQLLTRLRRKTYTKWRMAAAAILIFGAVTYLVVSRSTKPTNDPAAVALLLPGGSRWQLAEGAHFTNGNLTLRVDSNAASLVGVAPAGQSYILAVPPGKQFKIVLPDGSSAALSPSTILKFSFSEHGLIRHTELQGEALFNIRSDEQHPFTVHTTQGDITVLGTILQVNTFSALRVQLRRGLVRLASPSDTVRLEPHQTARLEASTGKWHVSDSYTGEPVVQHHRIYQVTNSTIPQITSLLARIYHLQIKMDSIPSNRTYSGQINTDSSLQYNIERLNCFQYTLQDSDSGRTLQVYGPKN